MGYTRVPRIVYAHIQVPDQPHKRPNKSPLRTRQTIGDAVECIQHDSHAAAPQRCSIGEHMGYTRVPRIVYAHIRVPDQPHKRPNKSPLRTRQTIGDAVECIQHDSHAATPQRCSIGEHMRCALALSYLCAQKYMQMSVEPSIIESPPGF